MAVTQQRMDKVTLGIIGCGHVSTIHLPLLTSSPRYEVRAMADVVEASAKQRAESFEVKHWSTVTTRCCLTTRSKRYLS